VKKEITDQELKESLPYDEAGFQSGMNRLIYHPLLPVIVESVFPTHTLENFQKFLKTIQNVESFQREVISKAISAILQQSSTELSISGLDNISPHRKYLYVSNHRDIICDPALFTNALFLHGYGTPKICLGDNLLTDQLIIDLVKMNKGITVRRNLPPRELLRSSIVLSDLISQQILENIDSVWIAQREGRAKDGNDQTHPGILKMLTLTGKGSFLDRIQDLHIVPVSISYEYDPCDIFKAREYHILSNQGSYHKAPLEDTVSMISGIQGFKGRIHIAVGKEIRNQLNHPGTLDSKRDQINLVVSEIDRQIQGNYRNWPSNYIAFDLLEDKNSMSNEYTLEKKAAFVERMEKSLATLSVSELDRRGIRQKYLEGYANSVRNAGKLEMSSASA